MPAPTDELVCPFLAMGLIGDLGHLCVRERCAWWIGADGYDGKSWRLGADGEVVRFNGRCAILGLFELNRLVEEFTRGMR